MIDTLGRLGRGAVDAPPPAVPLPESASEPELSKRNRPTCRKKSTCRKAAPERPEEERSDRLAAHSIRVNVDTLDHLMTTVSELVLTRNQLLAIVRSNEDSDFKVPLQRLSNVTAELQEGVMKTRMQPIGNAWQKLPRIVRDLCASLARTLSSKCAAPTPSSTARSSNWSRTR